MTFGPKPAGTWTGHKAANCGDNHHFLRAGERYEVIQAFTDYDQHLHAVGESWVFLGYSFLPYDDGMSFFVSFDGEQEWHPPAMAPGRTGPSAGWPRAVYPRAVVRAL